jgi:uncharacterized OB-fold protein
VTDWLVDDSLAPRTGGALAPLYAAAERGELALPHCNACGLALELEQLRCDACDAADVVWRSVARLGVVHAVTTVHRLEPGLVRASQPYHVADVELASGHRLIMTSATAITRPPRIGAAVTVSFRRVGGVAIPSFQEVSR